MIDRPLIRVAALVLLIAGAALPMRAGVQGAGAKARAAATISLGSDFATSLSGTIAGKSPGASRTVRLDVRRSSDDKTVHLALDIRNAAGTSGSNFTFDVPASALDIAGSSASLDTQQHLGSYGHISVQWKYTAQAARIAIPVDPCLGTAATSVTRAVAAATGRLALSLPGEGTVDVPLSGAKLNLDSGQHVTLRASSPAADQSIAFTRVSASKSLGEGKGLLVEGTRTAKVGRITITVQSAGTASYGLIVSSHFASDTLPLAGSNKAGQAATTLTYSGKLGTVNLVFTATAEPATANEQGRCVNPNSAGSDLSKTVGEQLTRSAVEGTASLTATATYGALRATFGGGDMGVVAVYGAALSSIGGPRPAARSVLPVPGSGDMPGIQQITMTPGGTLTTAKTISVFFEHALPAHAYVMFMLKGPGGVVVLWPPAVNGKTASATRFSDTALDTGTYTLYISATSDTGGSVFYEGTYAVSAAPSAGGTHGASATPVVAHTLPGNVVVIGDIPGIANINPFPGSTIARTPTIVVTFKSALPAGTHFEISVLMMDSKGNPTGEGQASGTVKGNTLTITEGASAPLSTGKGEFILVGGDDNGGVLEYRMTYTVT